MQIVNIDTCGFPYVHNLYAHIYESTPLPIDYQDYLEIVEDLQFTLSDIEEQLEIHTDDEEWRKSALTKRRILKQQIYLLHKWKQEYKKEKIAENGEDYKLLSNEQIYDALNRYRKQVENYRKQLTEFQVALDKLKKQIKAANEQ